MIDVIKCECLFCSNHEDGDTIYELSAWDGGIGFDYIRNIKYCPLCGKLLSKPKTICGNHDNVVNDVN